MMTNYVAVLAAAVAGWLIGAVYYMALGRRWMAAQGKTPEEIEAACKDRKMPMGPMALSFVALLLMALMLGGLIGHLSGLGPSKPEIGAVTGAFTWLGFVVTVIAVNNAFQGKRLALTVIDAVHWLLVLVAQGIVIGLIG